MNIKYLGTAAAEGIPAMFCDCDTCRKARELGGRNIRTRSQAIINGKILVDFNADTYCHILKYNVSLTKIRNCVITHVHSDHYYPNDLSNLFPGFAQVSQSVPNFKVFGSEDILDIPKNVHPYIDGVCDLIPVKPFESFEIENIKVTPLKANHGTNNPYIYIFEENGKSLFYANDTGNLLDETWEYLQNKKPHFDLVSFDCTGGNADDLNYESHMCVGRNIRCMEKMQSLGLVDKNTKYILTHFSHNGKDALYEDMCKAVEKYNFDVAYDGMEVEF